MAPSETEVLAHYLLRPSALTSILTYEQFQALFPPSLHSSTQLPTLFRDMRARREEVLAEVRANIAAEAKRGGLMRREVVKARRDAMAEEMDGEVEMERALFGDQSGAKVAKHTLSSILPELEGAAGAMEADIARLEEEEVALMAEMRRIVGGLSDLRYGRLSNENLPAEVVDGLDSLRHYCDDKS